MKRGTSGSSTWTMFRTHNVKDNEKLLEAADDSAKGVPLKHDPLSSMELLIWYRMGIAEPVIPK